MINKLELGEEMEVNIGDLYNYVNSGGCGKFQVKSNNKFENIGDIYRKSQKKIFKLVLDNGFTLSGSADHLVLIDTLLQSDDDINSNIELLDSDTWIRLSNITINEFVKTNIGSYKVKNIEFIRIDDTYDIEVLSKKHSYNSNGIISHNTGKSAIAEGLALNILNKKVARSLFKKRVVSLDLASVVGGTKFRGEFEERLNTIMKELNNNKDVILFIDEIHSIVGAGGASGSMDAANVLKPALSRGEIQCIGATTLDEYRKYIEKDGALTRRFQKIQIEPTTVDETIEILMNIKDVYGEHHGVKYTDDAIIACVKLSERYVTDRFLPDKAIDVMDEAGSKIQLTVTDIPKSITKLEKSIESLEKEKNNAVKRQDYEKATELRDIQRVTNETLNNKLEQWESSLSKKTVTKEDIAEIITMMTGVNVKKVNKDESEALYNMYDELKSSVIGQDKAIKSIVNAIQRSRIGLNDPNKPVGSFVFLGPTGVGKCIVKSSKVSLRNKKTGEIEEMDIESLIYNLADTNRTKKNI